MHLSIYTSIRHFLEVLAVFGTHISLKRTFDVIYLDICLPIYFFRGNGDSGNQRNGKNKIVMQSERKNFNYFVLSATF